MNVPGLMRVRVVPGALLALVALLGHAIADAHGVPQHELDTLARGSNLDYVWLGAKHMLTGYDHLLFLFGVVFFLQRPLDVVRFVTAFTLGHSLTLTLGTLLGVKVNYFLIDAVIALTVCYKGIENLDGFRRWLGVPSPALLHAVFAFGLVHGLGLATRLQQMPLPEQGLLSRILSFNLGVELGQVAALLVMTGALAMWRRRESFARFSAVTNQGLVFAGLLLFLMQLHGYLHTNHADELGFSEDLHEHAHEAIRLREQRAQHAETLD